MIDGAKDLVSDRAASDGLPPETHAGSLEPHTPNGGYASAQDVAAWRSNAGCL
jgi:hypothetical protein